jgi:predicted transcriptional regulator
MVSFHKIRFHKKGLETLMGPLECDILEFLWKKKNARVRDIYKVVKKKRKVALTSVAVILDRLHERNLVSRKVETGRGGHHYIYSAKISRNDFIYSIIEKTVNKMIECFGPIATNYFKERFGKKS